METVMQYEAPLALYIRGLWGYLRDFRPLYEGLCAPWVVLEFRSVYAVVSEGIKKRDVKRDGKHEPCMHVSLEWTLPALKKYRLK